MSLGGGTHQNCPFSGQSYTIATEPLLALLRRTGQDVVHLDLVFKANMLVSSYADDVCTLFKNGQDLEALQVYKRASSVTLN